MDPVHSDNAGPGDGHTDDAGSTSVAVMAVIGIPMTMRDDRERKLPPASALLRRLRAAGLARPAAEAQQRAAPRGPRPARPGWRPRTRCIQVPVPSAPPTQPRYHGATPHSAYAARADSAVAPDTALRDSAGKAGTAGSGADSSGGDSSEADSSEAGNSEGDSSEGDSSGADSSGADSSGADSSGADTPGGPAVGWGARTCPQDSARCLGRSRIVGRRLGMPHLRLQGPHGIT